MRFISILAFLAFIGAADPVGDSIIYRTVQGLATLGILALVWKIASTMEGVRRDVAPSLSHPQPYSRFNPMNTLTEFAWYLGLAIGRAYRAKGLPVLAGMANETALVLVTLTRAEISDATAEEKHVIERDVLDFFVTTWDVLTQEGLLLAEDIPGLLALGAWQQIKDAVTPN